MATVQNHLIELLPRKDVTAPLHALVQGPDAAWRIGYFRVPDTDVSEATDALIGDEEELLDPFEKERDADETANENRGAFTLSEFLQRRNGYTPSPLMGTAMVQVHRHHHAVMGFDAEQALLERTGLAVEVLDSGCCSMAFELRDGALRSLDKGRRARAAAGGARRAGRHADPRRRLQLPRTDRASTGRRALHVAHALAPGFRQT